MAIFDTISKTARSIFSSEKGSISSKRVCGVVGWLVVLGAFGYSTYANQDTPSGFGELIIGCCALLGVDTVTEIWKNRGDQL